MNLAVKFYSQVANPDSLPGLWPAEVIELGDSSNLPDGDWTLMSLAEFNAYREEHNYLFKEWQAYQESIWGKIGGFFNELF